MWSTREILLFLAGAQAFHTFTHIIIALSGALPLTFFSINWTSKLNTWGIIINALITIALLWWASKLTCQDKKQTQAIDTIFVGNIATLSKDKNFRKVLATGEKSQIVSMNIIPNQDIGNEVHDVDQIILFTQGNGNAVINNKKYSVTQGDIFFIPAGTYHNFTNNGSEELKLITIYAPAEFEHGIIESVKSQK